jgi:hypothetical protein
MRRLNILFAVAMIAFSNILPTGTFLELSSTTASTLTNGFLSKSFETFVLPLLQFTPDAEAQTEKLKVLPETGKLIGGGAGPSRSNSSQPTPPIHSKEPPTAIVVAIIGAIATIVGAWIAKERRKR